MDSAFAPAKPPAQNVTLGLVPRVQGDRSGICPWIPARTRYRSLGRDDIPSEPLI